MADIVNLYDAKTQLSQLVDRAADGEEIVIAKNGVAMARLMPMGGARKRRVPARALGLSSISPDFDGPLPLDVQTAFEGKS